MADSTKDPSEDQQSAFDQFIETSTCTSCAQSLPTMAIEYHAPWGTTQSRVPPYPKKKPYDKMKIQY